MALGPRSQCKGPRMNNTVIPDDLSATFGIAHGQINGRLIATLAR
jgi:hypothetical protein